jgi:hypothetical protein
MTAVLLCAALTTGGCASARGSRTSIDPQAPVVDRSVMADYAQRIPPGSKIRVERANGESMRGTLLKADAATITLQRNTRIPEPPVDIPIGSIMRLTLDQGSSAGRTIAIGIVSGVAATFGVLLLLAAIWSD